MTEQVAQGSFRASWTRIEGSRRYRGVIRDVAGKVVWSCESVDHCGDNRGHPTTRDAWDCSNVQLLSRQVASDAAR